VRWHQSLTPAQWRILLVLTASVIIVIGLLGWSVWTTLEAQPALSPLPTVAVSNSILPSPTPKPSATLTRTPFPTPTPPFDIARAGVIAADVADARGLLPRWNTPLTLVDLNDLSLALQQHHTVQPPLPLHMRTTLEALRLWSWDDAHASIAPLAQALSTAALYSSDTEELYLRRDWKGDLETMQWQVAYGYARAIPDQRGDLLRLRDDAASLDRRLALTAVGDGDALLSLWLYAGVEPGSTQAQALVDVVTDATLPRWKIKDPLLDGLSGLSLYLGSTFVTALYAEGGIPSVDTAIVRPPRSTEQLLHIEHYLNDDEPQVLPLLEPVLGREWTLTETETLGEALMALTLLEWSNGTITSEVAINWGGDLLQVWTGPEDADVVLWQTVWDSSRDAANFYGQLVSIFPRPVLPGLIRDTTPSAGLPRGRWWSGNQGAVFLRRYADRVWIVWGTDATAVEAVGVALP
jgi:hypothetical protein